MSYIFRTYKFLFVSLLLILLSNLSISQVLLNSGAYIQSNSGSYISVNGSVNNNLGEFSVNQSAGVPAEVYVSGDITNNANLIDNGHVRLLGNWFNNSVFTSNSGTVFFEGGNQILGGSVSSNFYNLTLDGSGLKTQSIDQSCYGILDLKHLELQTETYVFHVENNSVSAINRTSGFVSSKNGGKLSRITNQSSNYLFPVGSSFGQMRYRPVEIKPNSSANSEFAVRLANLDANVESYNRSLHETEICSLNNLFYHQIARTQGNNSADIFISYDFSGDGNWDGIANWKSSSSEWNIVSSSYTTASSPYYQAIKTNLTDFDNEPFILHKSIIIPSFSPIGPLCQNHAAPSLPSVSQQGISGTWSPATINTSQIGSFEYVFTPNPGQDCVIEYSMIIDVEDCCVMSINATVTQPLCHDDLGFISVSQSGGNSPITYTFNSEPGSTTYQGEAGTYFIVASDVYSCTASTTATIINPPELLLYLNSTPAQCGSVGGSAVASVVGGSPDYSFLWSPSAQTINHINDQSPGVYSVTVYDSNMCSAHSEIEIGAEGSISANITTTHGISCYGQSDGILEASSPNGSSPLSYSWNNGANSRLLTHLGTGSYIVTISDSWGCSGIASTSLTEPTQIVLSSTITNASCFGYSDGTIQITAVGGTGAYNYNWSNGFTTSIINNLSAGTYGLQVFDASACSVSGSFSITEPELLKLNAQIKNISCFGNTDGAISLSATGGNIPYNFSVFDGASWVGGNNFYNLSSGNYVVKVNDKNQCSDSSEYFLLEPSAISAYYSYSNPSCLGNNDGYIEILVSGGTEPYLFSWQNYVVDLPLLSGLAQGIYKITISDSNDCEYSLPVVNLVDIDEDCLKIPNAFTPNGDGINETWLIENIEMFPNSVISVYNRWGQKLFEGKGSGEMWDGTCNGRLVPTGSYIYVIEMFNRGLDYTGIVTIVY